MIEETWLEKLRENASIALVLICAFALGFACGYPAGREREATETIAAICADPDLALLRPAAVKRACP